MKVGIAFDLKQAVSPESLDDSQEEFDRPETIEAIRAALGRMGHTVQLLGDGREFLEKVLADRPDFVFNFAEGVGVSRSREARVPAVLEMLGIPFTGSDPLTMAVTLDKEIAKTIVSAAGVRVPGGHALKPHESLADVPAGRLVFPLVAKPAWEGSSKGIRQKCFVKTPAELPAVLDELRREYRQTVLLEQYIPGSELTVGIIGNQQTANVIGIMRVVPRRPGDHFIYSIEIKRDYQNQVDYESPARLSAEVEHDVRRAALAAYHALGCRDVARIDFRLDGSVPYFLEVNPLPGLNPIESDLVLLSKGYGWTYDRLIEAIVGAALQRVQE